MDCIAQRNYPNKTIQENKDLPNTQKGIARRNKPQERDKRLGQGMQMHSYYGMRGMRTVPKQGPNVLSDQWAN